MLIHTSCALAEEKNNVLILCIDDLKNKSGLTIEWPFFASWGEYCY